MASPLAGGFQLALGADLRYVAPGTRLAIIETRWGLVPDMAGTQLMRHLAGEDVVRELTYTGRIFCGRGGARLRVRHATDFGSGDCGPDHSQGNRGAKSRGNSAAKRLLNLAVACDAGTGLAAETAEQRGLLGRPNHVEASAPICKIGNRGHWLQPARPCSFPLTFKMNPPGSAPPTAPAGRRWCASWRDPSRSPRSGFPRGSSGPGLPASPASPPVHRATSLPAH